MPGGGGMTFHYVDPRNQILSTTFIGSIRVTCMYGWASTIMLTINMEYGTLRDK